MCTNSARLEDSLECYMDDLVDCFEDYVKKSLIIISVAAGALIVMLGYVLKIITDRSQIQNLRPPGVPQRTDAAINDMQSAPSSEEDLQKSRSRALPQMNSVALPYLKKECRTMSAAANTVPVSSILSFDEKVLRSVGLSSCSKRCLGKRSVTGNSSTSRIPCMPTCIPNRMYTRLPCRPEVMAQNSRPTSKDLRYFTNKASRYIWTAYNKMNGNYLALATVVAVVLLSFLIPDISQKIHATSELKNIKKVLNVMTILYLDTRNALLRFIYHPNWIPKKNEEVTRAEVACLTAADEICYLHCSMQDHGTETLRNLKDRSVCTSHCIRRSMSEPVIVEKKIDFYRRIFFPKRNTSHKEIAIMSYVYTNSFDTQKTINLPDGLDVLMTQSASAFEEK